MLKDFNKILIDFKSIPRFKRTRTFMEISGYPHYENVCSNILKFYLDPTNEHGLNDLVLNSLLHVVDEKFHFDLYFEKIEIFREFLTNAEGRLDLLILTDNYAIGIENKIFHYLHNDLNDYKATVETLCKDNSRMPICIVLSLNELTSEEDIEKIRKSKFKNVTYEQVFQNIKQNIGRFVNSSNISYINHLTDFIKSLENLTPKTMENKALWTFFKKNSETIQKLTNEFNEYKKSLLLKIHPLKEAIPQNEFAPTVKSQWIYENILVHDYIINSKYNLAIDTFIDINGWEIHLFGRNEESSDFIFNVLFKNDDFLPQPFDSYEQKGGRLIYEKFDVDEDIDIVAKTLINLLKRIEDYKKHTENNNI